MLKQFYIQTQSLEQNQTLYYQSMELQSEHFFPTQFPASERYSISFNQEPAHSLSPQQKRPYVRFLEAKSQAKNINHQFKETLKSFYRTKNSLDRTTHRTHKLRNDFIKVYGNKKLKFTQKEMLEQKKVNEQQFQKQRNHRTKSMKMNNQLGLMYTKNQSEMHNQKIKEQNRRQSEHLKKILRVKKKQEWDQAKNKFQTVKKGETEFLIRKKNISAMESTRARHNYLLKMGRQMEMLEQYTKLLENADSFPLANVHNMKEIDTESFNKTFFVTTRNTFKE